MPGATEPLRSELRIAAPPEVVFAYFTDPARMVDWMGVAAVLDPRPGGTFRIEPNGRDVVIGECLELEPPRRVVFSWGFAGPDAIVAAGSTRVEVTLEPDGEGTWLVLLHHDLPDALRDPHAEGWAHYLGRLGPVAARRAARAGPLDRPPLGGATCRRSTSARPSTPRPTRSTPRSGPKTVSRATGPINSTCPNRRAPSRVSAAGPTGPRRSRSASTRSNPAAASCGPRSAASPAGSAHRSPGSSSRPRTKAPSCTSRTAAGRTLPPTARWRCAATPGR